MEYNKYNNIPYNIWNTIKKCFLKNVKFNSETSIMQGEDGMFWQLGSPDQSLLSNKVTTETQANKQSDLVPKQEEGN